MSDSIDRVVGQHLSIWNAEATEERAGAIASTYADDVLVGEAEAVYRGHEGLAQAIDGLHAAMPGMQLQLSSGTQTAQTLTTYSWALAPAGAPAVLTGRD